MNSRCTNERWDCKVASTKGETAEKSSLQNFVEELQLEASTKVNVVIKNYWKLFSVIDICFSDFVNLQRTWKTK